MTLTKHKTCKDLVNESYDLLLDEWNKVIDKKFIDDENESLFDYVNQSKLSFEFVKADTFTDQKVGYYRLQLSYGGPSTEFRIYTDKDLNIHHVEYWYLDWFDGASIKIYSSTVLEILNQFLELESV
tara:strand:- start:40 stop:420 length:381 start_codon:yes stop_codon:yes gene_type:complete